MAARVQTLTVFLDRPANPPRFQLQCKVQHGLEPKGNGYLGHIRISMLDETLVDHGQTFLLRKGTECIGIYPSELQSDRVTLRWGEKNAVHISESSIQENQSAAAANQAIQAAKKVLSQNPSIVMEWGQFKKEITDKITLATFGYFSQSAEIWQPEQDADEEGPYTPFVEYTTRKALQWVQAQTSMQSILARIEDPLIVPWTA